MKDKTGIFIEELEYMLTENTFTEPTDVEIRRFIQAINSDEINIMDYRKKISAEEYGEDMVWAISKAYKKLS
ncbi:hypothetical protein [Oceanobacillus rekensis]|uniref:hypothetical protein n=1 Tax=Oceanobacillus rekensis TaxID=937927 RepID=UPI000B432125|nr:hypothetical protein [Oceanobacillus rekensis]